MVKVSFNRIAETLVLLWALIAATGTLLAQTAKVEVMIAGPWSYAVDPRFPDKIAVIGPDERHHTSPQLIPGGDVRKPNSATATTGLGKYDLTIQNIAKCSAGTSADSSVKLFPLPNIDYDRVIKPLIDGSGPRRYVFFLPKPCSYSAVHDDRSIIDTNLITSAANDSSYTTWIVFHYNVTGVAGAVLKALDSTSNVAGNDSTPFKTSQGYPVPAITLMMDAAVKDTRPTKCDPISVVSVQATGALYGKILHVWMPSADGEQQGAYMDQCQDAVPDQATLERMRSAADAFISAALIQQYTQNPTTTNLQRAEQELHNIEAAVPRLNLSDAAKKEIAHAGKTLQTQLNFAQKETKIKPFSLKLENFTSQISVFVVGSTDCRGAQLNVNNAIQ